MAHTIIHTQGYDIIQFLNSLLTNLSGYIPQYGTLERIGTVDFYPGTGPGAYGCYQPGCYDIFDVVACSHSRSHDYYMASIKDATCLADRFCGESDPKHFPDNCQDLLHNRTKIVTMGYWWPKADMTPGEYTVEITSTSPYCTDNVMTSTVEQSDVEN